MSALRWPRGGLGVAGSVALHVALIAALLLLVAPKAYPPLPKEKTVSVQILDTRQFEQAFAPPAPQLPEPALAIPGSPPDIPPPEIVTPPAFATVTVRPDGMMVPKAFLSAAALADPRSKSAREALPMLVPGDRIVQLCSIEAMAQIAALDPDAHPDMVAAYSMANIRYGDHEIDAPGAAFRSNGLWYRLTFTCGLTGGLDEVASFAFRVGEEIPHEQWADYDLVEGKDLDKH